MSGYLNPDTEVVYVNQFPRLGGETDDTGVITRAIQHCAANGVVNLSFDGQYAISDFIDEAISSLNIIGNQSKITINIADTAINTFAIKFTGDDAGAISVNDLELENPVPTNKLDNEKSTLINFGCTDYEVIQYNNLKSTKSHFVGLFVGNCSKGYMLNCRGTNSRDRGIQLSGVNNFTVERCYVENCGIGYATNPEIGYGITCSKLDANFNNNTNLTIQNSIFENCSRKAIDAHNANNVTVDDCVAHNFEYQGIYAVNEGADKRCDNIKVTNNHVYNDSAGYASNAGILIGNVEALFTMGFVHCFGNHLQEANALNHIAVSHDGPIDSLQLTDNTIYTSHTYNLMRGIRVNNGAGEISESVVMSNVVRMTSQGICCQLFDMRNVQVGDNNFFTAGNVAATIGLEVDNVQSLNELDNHIICSRHAGFERAYTNVTEYPKPWPTVSGGTLTSNEVTKDLTSRIGTEDKETVITTGYSSHFDGGGLTFVWDAASTASPDGSGDNAFPGLVIQPTGHTDPGRWVAVIDKQSVNTAWFGSDPSETAANNAANIQRAIDRAINEYGTWPWSCHVVIIPRGDYEIDETLHLGYGDQFTQCTFRSLNQRPARHVWGTKIKPTFRNRPAMNVQGCRNSMVEGVRFIGGRATQGINDPMPANKAAWDAVCTSGDQSKYCGISIDAFSGASQPAGSNYVAPKGWGKSHSSNFRARDCGFETLDVGMITKPQEGSGADANADYCYMENCEIEYCMYGMSINGSQTRGTRFDTCKVNDCYAGICVGHHGTYLGRYFLITNSAVERCTWWVKARNVDWLGQGIIENSFGEKCLGVFHGAGSAGGKTQFIIRNNDIRMYNGDDSTSEVRMFAGCSNAQMTVSDNMVWNWSPTRTSIIVRASNTLEMKGNSFVVFGGPDHGLQQWIAIPFRNNIRGGSSYDIGNNKGLKSSTDWHVFRSSQNLKTIRSGVYTANNQYTVDYDPGNILNVAEQGDLISWSSDFDVSEEALLFEFTTKGAAYANDSVITQLNNCTATDPVDSTLVISLLTGTNGTSRVHKSAANMTRAWASQLQDNTDPINVYGKGMGTQIWDKTNGKPVYANDGGASDNWLNADGTVAHTPVAP